MISKSQKEELEDMRQDMLETAHHEEHMVSDLEYFTEWVMNNLVIEDKSVFCDAIYILDKMLFNYPWTRKEVLDQMKEM